MTDPRSSTRFAVYLCPPQDDPYYRAGSELLGYDVRAGRELPLPDFLTPQDQTDAGPYGFHLTVVEGFFTDPARWPGVEAEARACVACLSPGAVLTLMGGRHSLGSPSGRERAAAGTSHIASRPALALCDGLAV